MDKTIITLKDTAEFTFNTYSLIAGLVIAVLLLTLIIVAAYRAGTDTGVCQMGNALMGISNRSYRRLKRETRGS